MSLRLRFYLALVGVVAIVLLALSPPAALDRRWAHYVVWTVICLLSEALWLPTLSKNGTTSMASTTNLAALMLWGTNASMWIVCLSTLAANVFLQKKPPVRALFNASQIVVTMWIAGLVMVLLGGPVDGFHPGESHELETALWRMIPAFLGLTLAYMTVNRALVSAAVAWSTGRRYLPVFWEVLVFRDRLFDDLALFLLSPLMAMSFRVVGYVGLVIFYAPLRIIYESGRRFAELKQAQDELIYSARMTAKGEIAASLAHDLRQPLSAISGRAQMLLADAARQQYGNVQKHAQIVFEQSNRIETMAQSLASLSHKELKIECVDLNELVTRSVELVRPLSRFEGVEWELRLAGGLPGLRADPGQLQGVLLNLFENGVDAMKENGTARRAIQVLTLRDEKAKGVRLLVSDSGPGVPAELHEKIFEPRYTTKKGGHGYGLANAYRIVMNHGGRIRVEDAPGGGARFVVILPLDGPGGWS